MLHNVPYTFTNTSNFCRNQCPTNFQFIFVFAQKENIYSIWIVSINIYLSFHYIS